MTQQMRGIARYAARATLIGLLASVIVLGAQMLTHAAAKAGGRICDILL